MGKWYLLVILLMVRLSIYIRQDLFFWLNKTGISQGLMLSCMKPFLNNSSTCLLSSTCSVGFILWWGKLGRLVPGTRSIACWLSHIGESLSGRSSGNTSVNSTITGARDQSVDFLGNFLGCEDHEELFAPYLDS